MSRAFIGRYTLNPRIRLPMINQPWEMHKRGSRQLGALWLAKILINSKKMRSGNIKILFQTMLWRTSEAYFVPYEISMMKLFRGISWRLKSRKLFLKKNSVFDAIQGLNLLSGNPTKWSNTLKQFVGNLPTNCLSVFDNFVGLAFKGLNTSNLHE